LLEESVQQFFVATSCMFGGMGARDGWNKEEEEVLVSAHNNLGNKWADIAKFIPG
jgi:hypothetical protein